jgi:hypothetical protein
MLDGRVGFHSSSCLEGLSVCLRVRLRGDVEAITFDLDSN